MISDSVVSKVLPIKEQIVLITKWIVQNWTIVRKIKDSTVHSFKKRQSFFNVLRGCRNEPATLLKVTLLHGCFSGFFNCTNGTKMAQCITYVCVFLIVYFFVSKCVPVKSQWHNKILLPFPWNFNRLVKSAVFLFLWYYRFI